MAHGSDLPDPYNPENVMFSMKTHTFIHLMSYKINRKYSQDIDKVRNNDFYFILFILFYNNIFFLQTLLFSPIIVHLQQLQPCRPLAF